MANGEKFIIATVADLQPGDVFADRTDYAVVLFVQPNVVYYNQTVVTYRYLGGEMATTRSFTNNSIVQIYTRIEEVFAA